MFQQSLVYKGAEVALSLVVISSADNLFARWAQQYSVLKLRCVRAFDVAQGRIRIHYTQVAQVLQCHQVLALSQAIQPSAAEGKSTKVFIDNIQQVFRPWEPRGKQRTCLRKKGHHQQAFTTEINKTPIKKQFRFQSVLGLHNPGMFFHTNQTFCSQKKVRFPTEKRHPSKQA